MDAVGHGYSCQEIQWKRLGNLWLPDSFEHVVPRNFMTPHNQLNCLRLNDGSQMEPSSGTLAGLITYTKLKQVTSVVQAYTGY